MVCTFSLRQMFQLHERNLVGTKDSGRCGDGQYSNIFRLFYLDEIVLSGYKI